MIKVKHFSESLEKNFKEIGAEIRQQKESTENKQISEKEVVSKAIKTISTVKELSDDKNNKEEKKDYSNIPGYISSEKSPVIADEVNNLISVAFKDGIFDAIKKAKKHPLFIQDALHDALVDKVLPELKKRGLIE